MCSCVAMQLRGHSTVAYSHAGVRVRSCVNLRTKEGRDRKRSGYRMGELFSFLLLA